MVPLKGFGVTNNKFGSVGCRGRFEMASKGRERGLGRGGVTGNVGNARGSKRGDNSWGSVRLRKHGDHVFFKGYGAPMKGTIVFISMKTVGLENGIIHEQLMGTDMVGWDKKTGIKSFSLVGDPKLPKQQVGRYDCMPSGEGEYVHHLEEYECQ